MNVEDNVVTALMRNLLIVLCESCSPCIIFGLNRISLHEHITIKWRGSMLNSSCDISTTFTPPFKYTMEMEEEGYLPFLDSVYRKKTHTDRYLQYSLHHSADVKRGVASCLFHRARTIENLWKEEDT